MDLERIVTSLEKVAASHGRLLDELAQTKQALSRIEQGMNRFTRYVDEIADWVQDQKEGWHDLGVVEKRGERVELRRPGES